MQKNKWKAFTLGIPIRDTLATYLGKISFFFVRKQNDCYLLDENFVNAYLKLRELPKKFDFLTVNVAWIRRSKLFKDFIKQFWDLFLRCFWLFLSKTFTNFYSSAIYCKISSTSLKLIRPSRIAHSSFLMSASLNIHSPLKLNFITKRKIQLKEKCI